MIVRSASRNSRNTKRSIDFSKILAVISLAGAGCICGSISCRAADKDKDKDLTPSSTASYGESVSKAVEGVFKQAQACVVKVEGVDARTHSVLAGTGFFVDPSGILYTCYTVGGDTEGIVVSYGEKKYPAHRLLGDPRSGIAILKIDARTPFIPIAKPGDQALATPVLVVGYPMNLPLTPSLGVVAGIDSGNKDGFFVTRHIRANVAVKPGLAGAPMLNLKGEFVGIVLTEVDASGAACYALPVEAVQKVRSDYDRFGEIDHGWIGISVLRAENAAGGSTAVVSNLIDGTPAAKSGLKSGDYVLQIGSKKITAPDDVPDASFFLTAGDDVPITILRGNDKIVIKVQAASERKPPFEVPMNVDSPSPGINTDVPLRMQP